MALILYTPPIDYKAILCKQYEDDQLEYSRQFYQFPSWTDTQQQIVIRKPFEKPNVTYVFHIHRQLKLYETYQASLRLRERCQLLFDDLNCVVKPGPRWSM